VPARLEPLKQVPHLSQHRRLRLPGFQVGGEAVPDTLEPVEKFRRPTPMVNLARLNVRKGDDSNSTIGRSPCGLSWCASRLGVEGREVNGIFAGSDGLEREEKRVGVFPVMVGFGPLTDASRDTELVRVNPSRKENVALVGEHPPDGTGRSFTLTRVRVE